VPATSSRPSEARQVWLSTPDGSVEAWYLPPLEASARPAPLIIFFHGNGELLDSLPGEFDEPRRWGMAVLLVEFPGYGRSQGDPSQSSVTNAALAAYDWASRQSAAIDRGRVVAYGRSLGGAAAAILASQRPTAALVLESTFTSVRTFAHSFLVPELVVRDPFDTLALLPRYPRPTLILHGLRDEIVPPEHAARLAKAAARSEVHYLPCGHNDCVRPWSIVRDFLTSAQALTN
jgi:fermentation-respiration switch protein FrsA (DUF1100 family)